MKRGQPSLTDRRDDANLEAEVDQLLSELFPISRSITGEGVRRTLERLKVVAEFSIREIPSGTQCFDWTVPDEWQVRDAYIADQSGRRLVDFHASNLHVVSYSTSVDAEVSFAELRPHLYTRPDLPTAIPYRTAYYGNEWGFCLSQERLEADFEPSGRYRVVIDASRTRGSMSYGEAFVSGTSGHEFLISSYCCHPSLANDNLSGLVLWAVLLRALREKGTRHSYRFVLAPETIGAVAYLASHAGDLGAVAGGFVLTTVGGRGPFGYKSSFLGDSLVDVAVRRTFRVLGITPAQYPFDVLGSDERQYSSPRFRIPMVTVTRDKYYEYPEYHTSLDDLSFISAGSIVESMRVYLDVIAELEASRSYRSLNPAGEPMLGKRNMYPAVGARHVDAQDQTQRDTRLALWIMFLGDGRHTLLEVAERSGSKLEDVDRVADNLAAQRLVEFW